MSEPTHRYEYRLTVVRSGWDQEVQDYGDDLEQALANYRCLTEELGYAVEFSARTVCKTPWTAVPIPPLSGRQKLVYAEE
jgi:hypothetical protein